MMKTRDSQGVPPFANSEGQRIRYNRKPIMKKSLASFLAALFFAGIFASLSGCNTVEGVGKDVQQGGKAIKDEANEQRR